MVFALGESDFTSESVGVRNETRALALVAVRKHDIILKALLGTLYKRHPAGEAILLLNVVARRQNGMRERAIITLYDDVFYGSAAVKAAPFINEAILAGASVVITAHNNPFGPAVATDSDMETNRMIDMALEQVGIAVAEHYVISGDKYLGTRERHRFALSAGTELDKFRQSRELAAVREEGEK